MIEAIAKQALEALMTQGSGWLVAVLLVVAIVLITRRHDKVVLAYEDNRAKALEVIADQYEKRIAAMNDAVVAVEQSTSALNAMNIGVSGHTETLNKLVTGFTQLARDLENYHDFHKDIQKDMLGKLEGLAQRVGQLQGRR